MSYFGLVTRDWLLVLFAYIGTAIVAGIAAAVVVALAHVERKAAAFVQWWGVRTARNERIERERAIRREHS